MSVQGVPVDPGMDNSFITESPSVNLPNDYTLTAGTNVTVTPDAETKTITIAAGSGGGATGTTGQVAYFSDDSTITSPSDTGTDSLSWDPTNKRLGIACPTPLAPLHVGNTTTSGSVGAGAIVLGVPQSSSNIGTNATILGGSQSANVAAGQDSLCAGWDNAAVGNAASVIAGWDNQVSGNNSVSGGEHNRINGGNDHQAFGYTSVITAGGYCFSTNQINTISNAYSSAAFGAYNTITGNGNATTGSYSFISGYNCFTGGNFSRVHGNNASDGGYAGCSVENDSTGTATVATAANQKIMEFNGGIFQIGPVNNQASITTITPGTGTGNVYWSMSQQGTGEKKVTIVFDGYTNIATATINFPTAFTYTPDYFVGAAAAGTTLTLSTTTATIPIIASTLSGVITIEGL